MRLSNGIYREGNSPEIAAIKNVLTTNSLMKTEHCKKTGRKANNSYLIIMGY